MIAASDHEHPNVSASYRSSIDLKDTLCASKMAQNKSFRPVSTAFFWQSLKWPCCLGFCAKLENDGAALESKLALMSRCLQ